MDSAYVALVISIGCGVVFGTIAYLLAERDKERTRDILKLEGLIKETATLVLNEKDKTAALVLAENRATAALVLIERDKLAIQVEANHNILEEKLTAFRIKVAEEYATTTLLEKLLKPIIQQLNDIERLLHTKADRKDIGSTRP